ncbi:MAG: acetyl-CoA C-acyltransferase [Candidatus Lernaella stagnicola]|nr:acetyl-CoA C-acyltransferase [Candidatus Lernaella stagnicola]
MAKRKQQSSKRRAVIVGGVRTPFLRAFGDFTKLDTIDLGVIVVRGLLEKLQLPWREIDSIMWGGVILPSTAVNIGREIILDLGLPEVEATTVTRACTTSLKAITDAVGMIERGEADVVVAGGSDSTSNAEVMMPRSFVHKAAPVFMSSRSTVKDYFALLGKLDVRRDLVPRTPSVRERTTGELMGESSEKMAKRNAISREAQDRFALQSHQRAAAAVATGRFADEIVPVDTPDGKRIHADGIVRGDSSLEKLAKLRPAFKKNGTLTAGNSSALTDGAAGVLLMNEAKARALGYTPRAAFRSWSYGAVDPADQLLIGPAISIPEALDRAGATLADIDVIDIHEAFAAQVLSVLKMLGSESWARQRLGREKAVGEVAPEEINLYGGSIALGHPFGATGARMVTTMVNELYRTDKNMALLAICAAGGLSGAAVLEAVE